MPKRFKYKNYTELAAAFKSGELDKHHFMLLGKGGSEAHLDYFNPKLSDRENEKRMEAARALFDGESRYGEHINQLFAALGIPCQDC